MEAALAGAVSALWLGILTSVSPCPLAPNVAALSWIARPLSSPRRVLLTGAAYSAGRALAYVALAALLAGSLLAIPDVSFWLELHMNKLLGPVLILVGLVLLGVLRFRLPGLSLGAGLEKRLGGAGPWGACVLGVIFALSFCPVSAALFFGSLLPLTLKSGSTLGLPLLYGLGTAAPVFFFGLLVALGARWVSRAFDRLAQAEKWARRITGVVFLLVGLRFCLNYLFEVQL